MRRHILGPLLLLAAILLLPSPAAAWWSGDWPYRMRVVIGAGMQDAAGQAMPPREVGRTTILVRLHQGNFNFNNAKEDGTDIRFVAGDDRTPLRFYVEKYDSLVDQVGLFWVSVPEVTLGGQGTPIYMYWGNRNAPPAGNARETLEQDKVLALNFTDEAGAPRDATGYMNNAAGATTAMRDDGLVGFGLRFDGDDAVALADSATLGWRAGETISWTMWIRPDTSEATGVLYQARGAGGARLTLGLAGGMPYAELAAEAGTAARLDGTQRIEGETWRHLALVSAGGRLALFLDGVKQAEAEAALPAMGGAATIGGATPAHAEGTAPAAGPVAEGFVGRMDVVRIAKMEQSPARLEVAVRGEGPRQDLLRFDVPEEGSVFGTGYFGIIARNLTHDAWVVIGICAFLAPITWFIFARKAVYISGLVGANRRFRRAFREALAAAGTRGIAGVEGLSDAAAHRRHRRSALYRLWRVGLEELDTRGGIGRAGNLSAASLAAIRAAVDREITGEQLKLNSGIVMLTIAISGGPFIGLLGTVIGVMITFAAVAAAGDVNVNAIAPGIAAALAATVAGLAVAIPALFGYNYLLTRIRDVNADLRVFADELVTRIGEGGSDTPTATRPQPLLHAAE